MKPEDLDTEAIIDALIDMPVDLSFDEMITEEEESGPDEGCAGARLEPDSSPLDL